MSNPDLIIYAVHVAFWGAFGIVRLILRSSEHDQLTKKSTSEKKQTAPFSKALIVFHMLAFGVMYFGIAKAALPNRVPVWFMGQQIVGSVVIALGAILIAWALIFFRSWRFRAKLDAGHKLATGGPFKILRHPIYMGLNLLALGTAIWIPTLIVWAGFLLMILGSDFRARTEESLLKRVFGVIYENYCSHTRRFLPGIY